MRLRFAPAWTALARDADNQMWRWVKLPPAGLRKKAAEGCLEVPPAVGYGMNGLLQQLWQNRSRHAAQSFPKLRRKTQGICL